MNDLYILLNFIFANLVDVVNLINTYWLIALPFSAYFIYLIINLLRMVRK